MKIVLPRSFDDKKKGAVGGNAVFYTKKGGDEWVPIAGNVVDKDCAVTVERYRLLQDALDSCDSCDSCESCDSQRSSRSTSRACFSRVSGPPRARGTRLSRRATSSWWRFATSRRTPRWASRCASSRPSWGLRR